MSQEELYINGELLRLRREARGWVLNDMATRACMSTKQIRQLEEGGMSSFYSLAVKATAAKKVATLLGVSEAEVFGHAVQVEAEEEALTSVEVADEMIAPLAEDAPVATVSESQAADKSSLASESAEEDEVSPHGAQSPKESEKNNTSLWVIVLLFASALGIAAYMRPADEVPVEAAPPLQVLPAEASDAASAASAAETPASASSSVADLGVVLAQKAASAAVNPSSSLLTATSVLSVSSAPRAPQAVTAPATPASKAP